jgi:hypothetical protein
MEEVREMAMRVLSGLLITRGVPRGSATIQFIPHHRVRGDGELAKTIEQGPERQFDSKPCRMVALREIKAADEYKRSNFITYEHVFRIDTTGTRDDLTITWDVRGDTHIEEISYMVIGEVPGE